MILGTSHLAKPDNGDLFMVDTDDVLTEKRQQEIKELIEALEVFGPTQVALEVLIERADKLNDEYRAYLSGDFSLTPSEHHQLGFRLAKAANLTEVPAVDWNETIEGIPDIGTWIEANGSDSISQTTSNEIRKVT